MAIGAALRYSVLLSLCLCFIGIESRRIGRLAVPDIIKQGSPPSLDLKRDDASLAADEKPPAPTVVECFQVAQPVLMPKGPATSDGYAANYPEKKSCSVHLMEHVFAWSYGAPFIGNYVPPQCEFNRVVINFTTVSVGRQYDRLAIMYLGDTEVWRTSTAEPVSPPGIRWVYLKDMTPYLSLWKQPQKLIFDLGNLINEKYTGSFNTTMTATFFWDETPSDAAKGPPSDLIIPISTRKSSADQPSLFTLPEEEATSTINFPPNANRAVFTISANGQASEEFWWSNVLQSDTLTFNETAGELPGYSPFREIRLLIDNQLAGVQWPFPVIFTGGIVPSLHRPIVGIDTFDLREHEIDITPFLPLLCDGRPHTFTIQVVGLNDDGKTATFTEKVATSWYVTGKIFVWLDDAGSVTTGTAPTREIPPPIISISRALGKTANGTNDTLDYTTSVSRSLQISGFVTSQKSSRPITWTQSLTYNNTGRLTAGGYDQTNVLQTRGEDASDFATGYRTVYAYPLSCDSSYSVTSQGNLTIFANYTQGLSLNVGGMSVFPTGIEATKAPSVATLLQTAIGGSAAFFQTGDGKSSSGYGTAAQVFSFGGLGVGEVYWRNVSAANNSVVYNRERFTSFAEDVRPSKLGGDVDAPAAEVPMFGTVEVQTPVEGGTGPRAFMHRGGLEGLKVDDGDSGGKRLPVRKQRFLG